MSSAVSAGAVGLALVGEDAADGSGSVEAGLGAGSAELGLGALGDRAGPPEVALGFICNARTFERSCAWDANGLMLQVYLLGKEAVRGAFGLRSMLDSTAGRRRSCVAVVC